MDIFNGLKEVVGGPQRLSIEYTNDLRSYFNDIEEDDRISDDLFSSDGNLKWQWLACIVRPFHDEIGLLRPFPTYSAYKLKYRCKDFFPTEDK